MFAFVHGNDTQIAVKIILKVLLLLIAPLNESFNNVLPKYYEHMDTAQLIKWMRQHIEQLPNSDEKTGKINILSWLMSKFWYYDVTLGKVT